MFKLIRWVGAGPEKNNYIFRRDSLTGTFGKRWGLSAKRTTLRTRWEGKHIKTNRIHASSNACVKHKMFGMSKPMVHLETNSILDVQK